MHTQRLMLRLLNLVVGIAMLVFSGLASADPPSRVARLGYISGAVSFLPGGENDWMQATLNRPLATGDRLWAEVGSRAEIEIGGAMIRMSARTGIAMLNLDDRIIQLQVTQGTLIVRVRRLEPGQVVEVDTPNLALTLRHPGAFRVEVDPDGDATAVFMRNGQAEVYGEGASYAINARQAYRFTGTTLRDVQTVFAERADEFELWASERDRAFDLSVSARYVSPDVIGYQDLDAYGTWHTDASYGNVWFPNQVVLGWAPYRDGHWIWIDPWGWTWVDDAPWGFAVTHYGRWAHVRDRWGWVPGPVRARAYYAPALVVFVGIVSGVAWFPLAPNEIYLPSYAGSRDYFAKVNLSNTVINTTVINNYYNNPNISNIIYRNRRVPGAVVAVPKSAFVQSLPVARNVVHDFPGMTANAPVAIAPPAVPTKGSVRGAGAERAQPPARVFERPVLARTTPPAVRPGLAAQQPQVPAKPAKPLDDAAQRELKPAMVAPPAPVVRVVPPTKEATRTLRPPTVNEKGTAQPKAGVTPPRQQPAAPKAGQRAEEPLPAASQPGANKRGSSKQELEVAPRKLRQQAVTTPRQNPASGR
ncbi:DUF6600 domain-containing protein [Rhodoferax sp.]|uniref:DUF6600 domain-containing protein n=1 Tax=Rhodoferax sp. TaxID=50421 RepID=UPI002619EADA|nr:DUF6600 domain-containing protein [Rhodoferax sp.]MDD2920170.1 hypothetical protein [Rhodoferax sp.]